MPCRMSLLFEAEVNRIKQLYKERIIEIQIGLKYVNQVVISYVEPIFTHFSCQKSNLNQQSPGK